MDKSAALAGIGPAGLGHRLPHAGDPVGDLVHGGRAAGEGYPLVIELKQVRRGQPGAGHVIDGHRALPAATRAIDEHHRDAVPAQLIDPAQVTSHRGEQDAVGTLLLEQRQVMPLPIGRGVTTRQDQRQAALGGDALNAAGDVGEERVAHVQDQQRDGAAPAGPQLAGGLVADEAEFGDGGANPLERGRRDPVGPVQRIGHRAERYSGPVSDVTDADAHLTPPY